MFRLVVNNFFSLILLKLFYVLIILNNIDTRYQSMKKNNLINCQNVKYLYFLNYWTEKKM